MYKLYLRLFTTFFKIGAFTFGGGWAMISIIEREIVDKHHWINREEFLDLLAISQSMPGILAVNISVSIGDKLRGLKGSIVAALGTILPSFLIILLIAMFLTPDLIKNNVIVSKIFMGIRPCVVALIIAPVITTARAAKISWRTVWIPIIVALLIYIGWNPIVFIILGGIGGYLWLSHTQKAVQQRLDEENNNQSKEGEE
jgi:chromate transporter